MTFLVIGLVLTGLGIIATTIGTVIQSKETTAYRDRSLKPKLDIINYSFNYNNPDNAFFSVKVLNSGNENCNNLAILIEDTNSPMLKKRVIRRIHTLPNGVDINFKIYSFIDNGENKSNNPKTIQEYEKFLNRFKNSTIAVMVKFCIHYEWNGKFYRTDTFHMMKLKSEPFIFFSNEGGAKIFTEDELDKKTGFPKSQFN